MVKSRDQNMKRRNNFTKMTGSIGEFHVLHYKPILKKYAYHRMLLFLLLKYDCKKLRREAFLQ